ncbi:MAG: hypothetical protein IJJ19_09060 [Erysipelotrichaceae bacterium]|nr:hypothetical protein [Erysipelotrichaceae bacterium]
MKKILTVLMVMLLALAGCAGGYNRNYNGKMGKITTVNEKKLKEMFDNGETFVVFAGTETCESCERFDPIVKQLVDENELTFYYFPADDYESEGVKDIIYNYFYKLDLTPSIYIVLEGRSVDMKEGVVDHDEMVRWLEKYEFIQ